jgi:hypothetical protein
MAKRKLTFEEFVRLGAAAGASKAGKASAAKLTPEERQERARKAVQARWARARAEREGALKKEGSKR